MEILPMGKIKFWLCFVALSIFVSDSYAACIDFNNTNIINSTEWVAGNDSYGQVYASNYVIDNNAAKMTESSGIISNLFTGNGTNSLLYSVSLDGVSAGSYNWSIDTKYSSFLTQRNYGQVYLVKNGQTIDLDSNIWNKSGKGSTIISKDYPGLFTGNEKWHTFGANFSISDKQLAQYDAIAFVFTGSKTSRQMLMYDNFNTNLVSSSASVPEPATIALISSGTLWVLFRKKRNQI